MNVPMRIVALFVLAVPLSGCKKDPKAEADKALAPFRAKAEANIAALKRLAPQMASAPRVTTDAVKLDAGPVVLAGREASEGTAGLLYEEDLKDVEAFHPLDKWPAPKAGLFGACGALLKGGGFTADHQKPQLLKSCGEAKYAVVVRSFERKAPVVREADKTFVPGAHAGEVHVWNLSTGKDLGGFRFSARNDERVKSRISGQASIEADLGINVEVAIEAGLAKFAR